MCMVFLRHHTTLHNIARSHHVLRRRGKCDGTKKKRNSTPWDQDTPNGNYLLSNISLIHIIQTISSEKRIPDGYHSGTVVPVCKSNVLVNRKTTEKNKNLVFTVFILTTMQQIEMCCNIEQYEYLSQMGR